MDYYLQKKIGSQVKLSLLMEGYQPLDKARSSFLVYNSAYVRQHVRKII